jgi:glycosyltransferase involved in cell wall biosynthesis
MRILISAFSCAPGRGSEPGLGWEVAAAAAENNDVWVLLDEHNRQWIEKDPRALRNLRATLVYLGLPWPLSLLFSIRWRGYLYYSLWQILAFFKARKLHRNVRFDLVHHVTYQNSWCPTWMGYLGVPFVWNGGFRQKTPRLLVSSLAWRTRVPELVRGILTGIFRPLTDRTVTRRAATVLSMAPADHWPAGTRVKALSCGGLSEDDLNALVAVAPRRVPPFRVAFIGRLIPSKGAAIGLQAFATLHRCVPASEFWIIGDGSERLRLEKLARSLGCSNAVRWLGWRSRHDVFELFRELDVVVHPSVRDAFGYTVVEAMAAAKPVLCFDAGAAAAIVSRGGGRVISCGDCGEATARMAAILELWARDPTQRESMGLEARAVAVAHYSWRNQSVALQQIYREVANGDLRLGRQRQPRTSWAKL